jgi:hypothetical protein
MHFFSAPRYCFLHTFNNWVTCLGTHNTVPLWNCKLSAMFRTPKSTNCPLPSEYHRYIFSSNRISAQPHRTWLLMDFSVLHELVSSRYDPTFSIRFDTATSDNPRIFASDEGWEGESNQIFYIILNGIPLGGKWLQLQRLIGLLDHAAKGAMTPQNADNYFSNYTT